MSERRIGAQSSAEESSNIKELRQYRHVVLQLMAGYIAQAAIRAANIYGMFACEGRVCSFMWEHLDVCMLQAGM